jgi:phage anti-repressor protein
MELEVLISNKGTRVVKATQLFHLLGLPVQHYGILVRRWLKDVYAFREGIRRPVVMKDYAPRRQQGGEQMVEDFYLSVELAKLIALHSKSREKLGISRRLQEYEAEEGAQHYFSKEDMSALLELTRAMCLRSCQEAAEQRHLRVFKSRNGGSAANWWRYRAHLLGYSTESLRTPYQEATGSDGKGKSQRQMLLQIDSYELIRTGVIDHYMSLGKNREFVRNMGDLAKSLSREMKLGVFDDCQAGNIFAPEINLEFIQQLNSFQMERA